MASIVNIQDFIGEINIPQRSYQEVAGLIQHFIDSYSFYSVENSMGYSFAKLYVASKSMQELPDRFKKIDEGDEYDIDQETFRFEGFSNASRNIPACYVFFKFLENQAAHFSGLGVSVSNSELGEAISPKDKLVSTWNKYIDGSISLNKFLKYKKGADGERLYPEFKIEQYNINIVNLRKVSEFAF